jgi:short-subunit dehydrogenase
MGWRRMALRLFRPLVRRWILSFSQPYRLAHSLAWQALQGRTALVTGASSGIGAATASYLAFHGMRVILVARREDRLQQMAKEIRDRGGDAIVFAADLAKEEECARLFEEVTRRFGPVEVLVNSAGLGWYGFLSEMPLQTARDMVAVNNGALVQLSLLFLQEMQRRGRGHIVQIGSIAGSLPEQGIALYSASKSFLDHFSRALYREVRGGPVRISVIKPGPVATEFYQASCQEGLHIPGERWAIRPKLVAQAVWSTLLRPRRLTYVPAWLAVTPILELLFGWAIDLLGPVLLRSQLKKVRTS